jgi:hypothetical protein
MLITQMQFTVVRCLKSLGRGYANHSKERRKGVGY